MRSFSRLQAAALVHATALGLLGHEIHRRGGGQVRFEGVGCLVHQRDAAGVGHLVAQALEFVLVKHRMAVETPA